MIKGRYCIAVLVAFGTLLGFGCSTKKNTAATRAYHELTTRYNVYFNAEEAYNEALKQIYDTPKDNYDELKTLFQGSPESYRGLFLIDKSGIVRHQVVNDMPLGRSVEEVLRVIDALQFTEENGEVCPANWHKGEKGLAATQDGIASYLSEK